MLADALRTDYKSDRESSKDEPKKLDMNDPTSMNKLLKIAQQR